MDNTPYLTFNEILDLDFEDHAALCLDWLAALHTSGEHSEEAMAAFDQMSKVLALLFLRETIDRPGTPSLVYQLSALCNEDARKAMLSRLRDMPWDFNDEEDRAWIKKQEKLRQEWLDFLLARGWGREPQRDQWSRILNIFISRQFRPSDVELMTDGELLSLRNIGPTQLARVRAYIPRAECLRRQSATKERAHWRVYPERLRDILREDTAAERGDSHGETS